LNAIKTQLIWVLLLIFGVQLGFPQAYADPDDLLPPPKPIEVSDNMDREIQRRRTMLRWHQGLGFATVAALGATVALGEINYDERFNRGSDRYQLTHRTLAITSATLFTASALLGQFAPVPFKKKHKLDTVSIHKWTMVLAALAMGAQIVLGVTARSKRGSQEERQFADAHRVLGFTTLGITTLGTAVLFF